MWLVMYQAWTFPSHFLPKFPSQSSLEKVQPSGISVSQAGPPNACFAFRRNSSQNSRCNPSGTLRLYAALQTRKTSGSAIRSGHLL